MDANSDIEDETLRKIERQEMLQQLQSLPTQTRLLLVMRFVSGQTLREISEQTGVKLPTVAFRIYKAIKNLRTKLTPEGV